MTDPLAAVSANVAQHMNYILKSFKPGAKITVIVRAPNYPERDFMLTSEDDLNEAKAVIERRMTVRPST